MCDSVIQEAEKMLSTIQKMRRIYLNLTLQEQDNLKQLGNVILENFPKFSVARFFDISRSTILNILSTVTTFFIIMIQFNGKD